MSVVSSYIAPELDLFSSKPVQSSIENSYIQEILPSTLIDSNLLEFHIPARQEI